MIGTKILEERKSKYNGNLRVVKTLGIGTYIQSEGLTQSGGIVEAIWKQTLKQIPNSKLQITNCLILGLGGGTVAKLIRKKYPDVKITGVEIDPTMVELGKKYLNLDKTGVDIKITDAKKFLAKHPPLITKYDLIVVDLYNGDKFPKRFGEKNYIHLVGFHLSRLGFVIFNRLYYGEKRPQAIRFGKILEKSFSKVKYFYPEANIMFICCK